MTTPSPLYKRVLLKISGEALMGGREFGLDLPTLDRVCHDIKVAHDAGVQVALVVGGGNIFRGLKGASNGIERSTADHMGMLATVMNALAMQSVLERMGIETRVMSAIPMQSICEPYIRRRADHHMQKGRVIICAAGTGNPYFTTDSAAALRASELHCDVIMKATKVDGVYSADPKTNPNATFYERLNYMQVLTDGLNVMDAAAIALAREKGIPVIVFSILQENGFMEVLRGQGRFTLIDDKALRA